MQPPQPRLTRAKQIANEYIKSRGSNSNSVTDLNIKRQFKLRRFTNAEPRIDCYNDEFVKTLKQQRMSIQKNLKESKNAPLTVNYRSLDPKKITINEKS